MDNFDLDWCHCDRTGNGHAVTVISTSGSVFMSIAGYFLPIVALIVGTIFGAENITPENLIACALILSGVAYAQFGGKKTTP